METEKADKKPRTDFKLYSKEFWFIITLSVFLGIGIGYLMSQNTAQAPIVIEQVVSD